MKNALYFGDNLNVMREMQTRRYHTCYLDPPYNSGRNYNIFLAGSKAQRIRAASPCLNQDVQDEQDEQDDSPYRRDGRHQTIGSRSERTLMRRGFCDACEGQALALRAPRRAFFS